MDKFFFNPGMLAGAAAIAAPIIIWLLTRYRYRTIDWAALEFLLRAVKKEQRRLRLENLILLILRCLLLILFALVLARPRSVARVEVDAEDKRHNVVIVLDTSYSTAYQIGSDETETAYQRELRAAKEVISFLEDEDRVLVVGFDETARGLYHMPRNMNATGRREVSQDLDAEDLKQAARGTDLGGALHTVSELLVRFEPDGRPPEGEAKPLQKTVFLLTDAQRRGLLNESGELIDQGVKVAAKKVEELGGTLVLVDCGAEEPVNASIVRLQSREPVVGQGLPCHIEVSVKNWAAEDVKDLTVSYFVDGAPDPQKTVSVTLPAGEEVTPEPLRYTFSEPGPHRVAVQLTSDALTMDNWRHHVIDVRRNVRVLLVDGEPSRTSWEGETDFVDVALSLSTQVGEDGFGLLRPEVVDEASLPGKRLGDYDIVVLANIVSLEDEAIASLESYARAGGAVVFSMGDFVDKEAYNDSLWRNGAGIFPCRLVDKRGGTRAEAELDRDAPVWVMHPGEREHPIASLFGADDMITHLRLPSIYGFYAVELAREGGVGGAAQVPLRLIARSVDDSLDEVGLPLLVEREFGRGRCVVWLSTMDYAWNNCVTYDGFFVPFWRLLALDLAQRSRPRLNMPVGGRYERLLRPEEYSADVTVETPDGRREKIQLEKLEEQEFYRLVYPPDIPLDEGEDRASPRGGTEVPGFYSVTRSRVAGSDEDPPPEYFGVTLDPSEGDLAKYSAEELQSGLGVQVARAKQDQVREVLASESGVGGGQEFWRHFLVAVIVLLVLESVLAAAFGRKRR
jgi:hypothetical protein